MDLKKTLNLNTYEWWRNHRRFVTLGLFIALAAGYVRAPIAKDFNVKDTCSRYYSNFITSKEAARRLDIPTNLARPFISKSTNENLRNYCDYMDRR